MEPVSSVDDQVVVIGVFLDASLSFLVRLCLGVVSEVGQFTSSGLKGILECFGAQICGVR